MPAIREIVQGSFTGFLPVCLAELVAIVILFDKAFGISVEPGQYPVLLWAGGMTAGHLLTMLLLRRRLRDDSFPAGRKTIVAGFCAALALAAVGLVANGLTDVGETLLAGLAGAAASIAIYFPWIRAGDRDAIISSSSSPSPLLTASDAGTSSDVMLDTLAEYEPRRQD